MGLFDSVTFSPPDFQMGNFGEPFGDFLRRKDRDRLKLREEERFEMDLGRMRQRQELDRMSKVMNPAAQVQPVQGGLRAAPYNPSLDEYRKDKIELDREKIAAGKEKEEGRLGVANRNTDIKERLAALKDMTESEKFKLLQEGKITLQEMRDSASMNRVVETGEQTRKTEEVRQSGRMDLEKARQLGRITLQELNSLSDQELEQLRQEGRIQVVGAQGEQARQTAIVRAQEARKTKAAPSSSTNSQLPSQQKVTLQNKAVQLVNQNPQYGAFVTFNEQGFPVISPDAPPEAQMDIYRNIYGTSPTTPTVQPRGDVNLPAPTGTPPPSTSGVTQPVATQPTVTQPTAVQPNAIPPSGVRVPQMTEGFKPDTPQTINSPSPPNSGMIEMTTPDGRGTRMVPKDKVQIALSQGYKQKGQ